MSKTDRRYRRTRQFIMDAFTALLKKEPFDKISINEIADLANINRATFYLHFVDKYALLDEFIDELLKDLYAESGMLSHSPDFSGIEHSLTAVLSCFYEKKDMFRILFKEENYPYFQPRFKAIIAGLIAQDTKPQADDDTLEAEFRIQIKTSALAGIIEWWLSGDISLTVEAMVRNILKVLVKLETLDIKAE